MLLKRRRNTQDENVVDLNSRLQESENRESAYDTVIRTLLVLVKDFALDIAELKTDRFYASVDTFSEKFFAQKKSKRILPHFEKQKPVISSFIDKQKKYLDEREAELRNIIDLLTRAMVSVDSENDAYHQKILRQS